MDREALARASRRRDALDALTFERDREAVLASQLEDVVAERDGRVLDELLFARLDPEDAALVRAALGGPPFEPGGADYDGDDEGGEDEEDEEDGADEHEQEVMRLEAELEASRRIQAALERYIALLAETPARPGP